MDMDSNSAGKAVAVIQRLIAAGNAHDLPAFLACFAADYLSEQPIHPDRTFRGRAQVEKNWSATFASIPDFHIELLDLAINGYQVWFETIWTGTLEDKSPFRWQGVSIFTVEGGEITAGRLYMEPVQEAGPGIDETVKEMTGR